MGAPLRIVRADGAVWTFDGFVRPQYQPRARSTDHPVEGGGMVTDNIVVQPQRVTVEGIVTETPFEAYGQPIGAARLDAARAFLRGAQGNLVDVQLPLGTLANYSLNGWTHEQNGRRSLRFRLDLREIQVVQAATVEIPADAPRPDVAADVADEVDVGGQPTEDVDTEVEADQAEDNTSTLAAIFGATE